MGFQSSRPQSYKITREKKREALRFLLEDLLRSSLSLVGRACPESLVGSPSETPLVGPPVRLPEGFREGLRSRAHEQMINQN